MLKDFRPKTKNLRPRFAIFLFQFSICGAFLLPALGLLAQQQDQDDVLRVESDLTTILFTATDKKNRFITNLQESDIRVLEDGTPQKLFTFQRETDRALSIAFLIDVSKSQEYTLPQEKAAARTFIENVVRTGKDHAAIIPFAGYAHLEQPLTGNVLDLYRAIERVEVAFPSYLGSAPPISGITSSPGTVGPPLEQATSIWDSVLLTSGAFWLRIASHAAGRSFC